MSILAFSGALWGGDVPGWHRSGNAKQDFEISLDRETRRNGNASGMIECLKTRSTGLGTLEQDFAPDEYYGQRIRLTAWVMGLNSGSVMMFLRVDGHFGEVLAFDNTQNRAPHGTFDWRKQ
jgi:hypothetical protein